MLATQRCCAPPVYENRAAKLPRNCVSFYFFSKIERLRVYFFAQLLILSRCYCYQIILTSRKYNEAKLCVKTVKHFILLAWLTVRCGNQRVLRSSRRAGFPNTMVLLRLGVRIPVLAPVTATASSGWNTCKAMRSTLNRRTWNTW